MTDDEELLQMADILGCSPAEASKRLAGIRATPRRPPAVPRVLPPYLIAARNPAPQSASSPKYLLIAIILAASVAAAIYFAATRNTQETASVASPLTPSVATPPISAKTPSPSVARAELTPSVSTAASAAAFNNSLRPADFLETLGSGKKLDLKKFSSLTLPANGKPLIIKVVLYARLDDLTEQRWRAHGLFANESTTTTPFLRSVTLKDQDSLDLLLDWHVEGFL